METTNMDLIPIQTNNEGIRTVNARDLHTFLESKQEFTAWIKNRIEQYKFVQDIDFVQFDNFIKSESKARKEYHITIDMAKELSMVERTEKGHTARQYFICLHKPK